MVRNDYWSFDQDLEGVRSLGAVLIDGPLFCRNKAWAQGWAFMDSAAARDCSPPDRSQSVVGRNLFKGGMASAFAKG
jgi:hypothetical protein